MANIIATFSDYIKNDFGRREIAQSQELKVAKRYQAITAKLRELRKETLEHSFVDKDGAVKINNTEAFESLQNEIAAHEGRLRKITDLSGRVNEILDSHKGESVHDIQVKRDRASDIIKTAPFEAWAALREARGEGLPGDKNRVSMFPSDLIEASPAFKKAEDALRAQRDAAMAEKARLDTDIKRLDDLLGEAAVA